MSEIKVNKISPRSGTTVTLGDSGDTFTIPSGATINNQGTATNFGATGSASWNTTVKTSTFTAVAGEGYFVNTTGGAVTVNLPAGTAGAVVAVKDYANTFDTNAVTLAPNGSDKIAGNNTVDATLNTEGIAVTLVFIDSTQGWLVTDSGLQSEAPTAEFITATGGTITTVDTNYKVHTFTGPGTFTVNSAGNAAGSNSVDYMIVAGGGGGGIGYASGYCGGGGGAGGYRESPGTASGCYSVSPLGTSPAVALPVSVQGYPVVVGGGGAGKVGCSGNSPGPNVAAGGNGIASSALGISSAGGGGGAGGDRDAKSVVGSGGSGGGGAYDNASPAHAGGSGNTPPVNPSQGNNGGSAGPGSQNSGGGGGGATAVGGNISSPSVGGTGGAGAASSITGTPVTRAGGGGGSGNAAGIAPGGAGGGGAGATNGPAVNGVVGTINTGGGGGGGVQYSNGVGANGGSGIVVIRYKFQ
jgi:hypothetical protein